MINSISLFYIGTSDPENISYYSVTNEVIQTFNQNNILIDLMDVIMFKSGVKKKMLQVRLNELFSSSYRFLSEGLGWTSPEGIIDEQGDVLRIEVYPEYLPIGILFDAFSIGPRFMKLF